MHSIEAQNYWMDINRHSMKKKKRKQVLFIQIWKNIRGWAIKNWMLFTIFLYLNPNANDEYRWRVYWIALYTINRIVSFCLLLLKRSKRKFDQYFRILNGILVWLITRVYKLSQTVYLYFFFFLLSCLKNGICKSRNSNIERKI